MTSVLPAWKVELLEKKKKKEQDQRQKLEDEKARNVAIPEWKRSLLERKKEGSSDLPETRNAGQPGSLSVNSVFGTRILRKNSEKTIAIATASQRPVSKSEDELIDTRNVLQHHEFASNAVVPKVNSCVTNAVDIPTEVEHSGNKRGSLRREVINGSDHSQCSDVASPREDLEVKSSSNESHKVELDNELVTVPSVLTYKRMFERSKPGNDKEISASWSALSTESFKTDFKSNKSTSENTLDIVNNNEQAQIPNKSFGNIAQSVFSTKSTSVTEPEMLEHKTSGPSYSIAPKPYKNFVITPPWLKNSLPRNVNFHPGKISFQDPLATAADRSCEDLQQSDQNRVIESPTQDKVEKISANSDVIISASATEQGKEKAPETDFKEYAPHQSKQSCAQDDQLAVSCVMASGNQKYVLISSKSQQDITVSSERAIADNRQENTIVPVSNESLRSQQRTEDSVSHERFIDSVRSKFGHSVGNQRRTSSEENIFQKTNQSQPIKQEGVVRRAGQSKRTHPSMVRWSADVLSLMSQQIDDSDFDSLTLSVRSASKIPSASDSHAKRPPPPTKRWTADVLSVTSVQADSEAPELSPRSDSSARSSPGNSLNRVRSSSLSDVREEHGVDYFQHKANVSQGIEHRMHKLIRKASISENILNLEQEGSDSLSDEDSLGVNDEDFESEKVPDAMDTLKNEITGHKVTDIGPNEKDSKPPFSPRKHSISQNIENKLCELFQRQVSQQSDEGESEGERTSEYDFRTSTDKVVEEVAESTPEELKDDVTPMVTTNKSSTYITQRLGEELNGELDEMEPERNAVKGSVHKLSSLFGSSIWKPNKKNKGSSENKHELKEEPGSKPQKDLSTPKKEDSKKSNLFGKSHKIEGNNKETDSSNVNIFPWLKNLEKDKDRGSKIANNQSKNKSYAQKKSSWRSTNQDIDNVQTGWQPAGKTDQETDVVHVLQPVHNTTQDISAIHNAANPLPPVRKTDQDIDTLKTAAHALRPVHKAEKVKQRQLVGKVMIISNASHDDSLPKGVYHKPSIQLPDENKEMASTEARDSKSVMGTRGNEAQIPVVVTEHWNHKQHSLEMEKRMEESVPVTSIDEVPVSAIDIPELCESDVVVSVIDIPASPDVHSAGNFALLNVSSEGSPRSDDDKDDICVSVIDLPSPVAKEDEPSIPQAGYLETEEMLDESDTDEVEGSYDFATGEVTHIMNGHSALESDEESDDDADENDDDDDDDIPISYIGASPRYQVPQVVFDTEPVALKSCLSPKPARKKMKGKVSFKSSHTIHDYPSEEAFIAVFDELQGNNAMPLKTLQNYQPSALANMEKILERAGGNQPIQEIPPAYSNGLDSEHDASVTVDNHPEIKYTDEGQGFTDSSDYASALLF